jgi:hypothetical protein
MPVFIMTFLLSLTAFADSKCTTQKVSSAVEKCLENVISVLAQNSSEVSDSPEVTKKAAELFLSQYKDSVEFDVASAKELSERLTKHAGSSKLSPQVRSQLWLLAAGVHGRLADKLRANGGLEQGKFALNAIKTSLSLDKNYKSAAISYATTISAFTEQNFISKKFIEANMDIKISGEVKSALKAMEDAGLMNHELYQKLKKV